ncbi:MAG: hypothetical protein RKU31_01740 [Deltaproteobacteria bacterium]|jgi:hypothetical protein
MTSRKKPEVLASAIDSSVGTLSSDQQHIVERGVRGGATIEEVVEEIRADFLANRVDAIRSNIAVPAPLVGTVDVDAYQDGLLDTACQSHASREMPRAWDLVGPELDLAQAIAERADDALPAAQAVVAQSQHAVDERGDRDELHEHATPELVHRLKRWIRLLTTVVGILFTIEIGAFARTFGDVAGVADGRAWAAVVFMAIGCAIANLVVVHGGAALIARLALPRVVLRIALGVLGVGFVGFVVALGGIRYGAALSDVEIAAITDLLALADMVITIVVIATSPIAIWYMLGKRRVAVERYEEALRDLEQLTAQRARRATRLAAAEHHVAQLKTQTEVPHRIVQAFELGVRSIWRTLDERDLELARVEAAARSLHRVLKSQSPAMRDAVRVELRGLRPVEEGPRGGTTSTSNGMGRGLLMFALVSATIMASGACTSSPSAPDVVAICDRSGPAPACTDDVLQRSLFAWAMGATDRPGATWRVVDTTGSMAETRVTARVSVPRTFSGNLRAARAAWIRAALDNLSKGPESTIDTSMNRSDLLAAFVLAARQRTGDERDVRLVVISDGWLVTRGVTNFEKVVPSLDVLTERMKAKGYDIDLSRFSAITVCGLGTAGGTPRRVAARDELLRTLIPALGGKPPVLLSSCADLWPAVPAAYASPGSSVARP